MKICKKCPNEVNGKKIVCFDCRRELQRKIAKEYWIKHSRNQKKNPIYFKKWNVSKTHRLKPIDLSPA